MTPFFLQKSNRSAKIRILRKFLRKGTSTRVNPRRRVVNPVLVTQVQAQMRTFKSYLFLSFLSSLPTSAVLQPCPIFLPMGSERWGKIHSRILLRILQALPCLIRHLSFLSQLFFALALDLSSGLL